MLLHLACRRRTQALSRMFLRASSRPAAHMQRAAGRTAAATGRHARFGTSRTLRACASMQPAASPAPPPPRSPRPPSRTLRYHAAFCMCWHVAHAAQCMCSHVTPPSAPPAPCAGRPAASAARPGPGSACLCSRRRRARRRRRSGWRLRVSVCAGPPRHMGGLGFRGLCFGRGTCDTHV